MAIILRVWLHVWCALPSTVIIFNLHVRPIAFQRKRGPWLENLFSRHGSLLKTDRTTSDCLLSTTGQGGPTTRKSNKKNNSTIQIRRSYIQTSQNAITSQALWLLNRWPYVWECLSGLASPLLITYTRLHIVWELLLLHSQSSCWFGTYRLRDFSQPHKTKEQLVSPPIHLLISIFYGNFLF
jgi:hypothetical protein